jgi:hypothetical protein
MIDFKLIIKMRRGFLPLRTFALKGTMQSNDHLSISIRWNIGESFPFYH